VGRGPASHCSHTRAAKWNSLSGDSGPGPTTAGVVRLHAWHRPGRCKAAPAVNPACTEVVYRRSPFGLLIDNNIRPKRPQKKYPAHIQPSTCVRDRGKNNQVSLAWERQLCSLVLYSAQQRTVTKVKKIYQHS
jgi:hypothetical protein